MIGLLPLGKYNEQQLLFVSQQLKEFFNIRVLVLQPTEIPPSFRDNTGLDEKYSADSLVKFLSTFCNDSIVDVAGLTDKDIYTIREHKTQMNNKTILSYETRGIFGLGYVNGNSCIISGFRIASADNNLFNNRLRKVILHEIGHNLGLPHCSVDTCIMSETNGDIVNLNKTGGDYCPKCRRKLH
jgi:archaemetzincin